GATTRPVPSMSRGLPATANRPTATIRSPRMARSTSCPGWPLPSYSVAPRMTTSASTAGSAPSRVNRASVVRLNMRVPLAVVGRRSFRSRRLERDIDLPAPFRHRPRQLRPLRVAIARWQALLGRRLDRRYTRWLGRAVRHDALANDDLVFAG